MLWTTWAVPAQNLRERYESDTIFGKGGHTCSDSLKEREREREEDAYTPEERRS